MTLTMFLQHFAFFSHAQAVEEMLPCMKSRGGSGAGIPPAE